MAVSETKVHVGTVSVPFRWFDARPAASARRFTGL